MDFRGVFRRIYVMAAFVSAVAVNSGAILADPSRTPANISESFQSITSGRALSQKDVLFRSLLSTEGKDLDWPSFPRTWHEESVAEVVVTNTTLGLPPGTPLNAAVSIDYKWGLKTSLVIIASGRKDESVDGHQVSINPVDDPLEFEILRWDEKTKRALPNVRKGYPMVAFCAFEASLNYSVSNKGGVQFLGNGQSVETGKVRSISHTIFSRFIQLDGQMSPLEMLQELCERKFRAQVEQFVNRDFTKSVTELYAYTDALNQCQEDPKHDGASGDAGCMEWQSENFGRAYQALTVPRCVLTRYGVHRCELRAKENGNCSMYWDKSTKSSIPLADTEHGRYYPKATESADEFNCDQKQNLKCQMVSQPVTLLNVPVWGGVARCLKSGA